MKTDKQIIKEQREEIERLKKELKLSNLERCPHDYQLFKTENVNLLSALNKKCKEIENLKRSFFHLETENDGLQELLNKQITKYNNLNSRITVLECLK